MNAIHYMEKMTEVANGNGQAMQSILDLSLEAMRELGSLNGEFIQALAEETQGAASDTALEAQLRRQAQQVEKGSNYFREVNTVLMKTQADIGKLQIRRMNDLFDSFQRQLGEMVPPTRGASDDMIDALKDGFARASAAYEQAFSLSRDLLDNSMKSMLATPRPAARPARARAGK
ncbi:MAG: phasin family protein, partial [Proteobacteria bacterium]